MLVGPWEFAAWEGWCYWCAQAEEQQHVVVVVVYRRSGKMEHSYHV
jgi:hypothetical protein